MKSLVRPSPDAIGVLCFYLCHQFRRPKPSKDLFFKEGGKNAESCQPCADPLRHVPEPLCHAPLCHAEVLSRDLSGKSIDGTAPLNIGKLNNGTVTVKGKLPTLLVNGRDVETGCSLQALFACRTYVVDGKLLGVPSRSWIEHAIRDAKKQEASQL